MPLDIRFWTCEKCQTKHDRDINAAINLTRRGTTNTSAAPCTERGRSRAC
ncbi:MAG: zinc ribbon domain-containing protein [Cuspidothrix sp.]